MSMDVGGKGLKNEINVTPLVDVCLVLLIIFMVVTPMLQEGVPVQLPQAQNPDPQPDKENAITISISAEGKVYLEDNWIPADVLRESLASTFERNANKLIYVKGDKRIPFGEMKKVMKIVQDVGFKKVGLVAEHVDEKGNVVTGSAAGAMINK